MLQPTGQAQSESRAGVTATATRWTHHGPMRIANLVAQAEESRARIWNHDRAVGHAAWDIHPSDYIAGVEGKIVGLLKGKACAIPIERRFVVGHENVQLGKRD